jgi:hypothetical protein
MVEQQLAEFMASLLVTGMNREQVAAHGYEFALASIVERTQQHKSNATATTDNMAWAARNVQDSMPMATRIFDDRYKMR